MCKLLRKMLAIACSLPLCALSLSTLSLSTLSLSAHAEGVVFSTQVPKIVTEFQNEQYDNLFQLIAMTHHGNAHEFQAVGEFIIENVDSANKCNDAIYPYLIHMYDKAMAETNELTRLLNEISDACPNKLLTQALMAFDGENNNTFYAYQYIDALIKAPTELARGIAKGAFKSKKNEALAIQIYDNRSYKGLIQTYILKTLHDNRNSIDDKDKLSLVVGLLVLSEAYQKKKQIMLSRMVTWTVIKDLQDNHFIDDYIYRSEENIYFY